MFSLLRTRVRFLVRELRSHRLHSEAKINKSGQTTCRTGFGFAICPVHQELPVPLGGSSNLTWGSFLPTGPSAPQSSPWPALKDGL